MCEVEGCSVCSGWSHDDLADLDEFMESLDVYDEDSDTGEPTTVTYYQLGYGTVDPSDSERKTEMCVHEKNPAEAATSHGANGETSPTNNQKPITLHMKNWRKSTRVTFGTYCGERLDRNIQLDVMVSASDLYEIDDERNTLVELCPECVTNQVGELDRLRALVEAQEKASLRRTRKNEIAHEIAEAALKGDKRRVVSLAGRIAQLEAEGCA